MTTTWRRANLEEPKTIDEARERMVYVQAEIAALETMLAERFRFHDDGMPYTPEEYGSWRRRTTGALTWWTRERAVLETWLDAYKKEVKAEQDEEERRLRIEAKQRTAEKKRARAEMLLQRDKENKEWRNRMLREYGTNRLPPDIARAEEIELQRLRLEVQQAEIRRFGMSQRRHEQKLRQKEWIRLLEMEECEEVLDPAHLLARAFRLLHKLYREKRVVYTDEELALLSVIQERQLILNHMEDERALDNLAEQV